MKGDCRWATVQDKCKLGIGGFGDATFFDTFDYIWAAERSPGQRSAKERERNKRCLGGPPFRYETRIAALPKRDKHSGNALH